MRENPGFSHYCLPLLEFSQKSTDTETWGVELANFVLLKYRVEQQRVKNESKDA